MPTVASTFAIGLPVSPGQVILPVKFLVYDEINNTVLYEYHAGNNPDKFDTHNENIHKAESTSLWGKNFIFHIKNYRVFEMNFRAVSATQKSALETIFNYGHMILFYYIDPMNASAMAKCEWINGFEFVQRGTKYYGKVVLEEVA
ncbi:hypothetical protein A2368_01555 [Candidatus Collierbacteria bacterium RIFOXYB1_FULL_49_13]|uniref:Uncharacterized protein n=1 Tax=Candidatus Collierbacteria bacterium RIFOXYB1_FULL_49_13 TaxID=1817728 RepID=A0A1F5FGJ9_9BACT|nr:MAG: hypothetical protein A2368_01555 [Candidatus Collierbacteria bacterium RIFOXYB1_FULL_49_13]